MSYTEFRKINEELNAIASIQKQENIIICANCTGKGFVNKNFKNPDGSATLLKEKTCDTCRGKGVVVENREIGW